jgi:hypothetical protein
VDVTGPAATDERRSPPGPRTILWAALGALVALVAILLVADAVRGPTVLDPATPEGVVQGYVQQLLEGDRLAARAYLSDALQRRCSSSDVRRAWVPEGTTVSLGDVDVDGGEARVTVLVRSLAGPERLGGTGEATTETFELVQQDGEWRITGEPWPVYECRGW